MGDASLNSSRDSRSAIRQQMRSRRRALDSHTRTSAAESLSALLTTLPYCRSAQRVAVYLAVDGEMDTQRLLQQLHHEGKHIYLPILPKHRSQALRFNAWSPGVPMRENRLRIPEPVISEATGIEPESLDLVLVPLVAFDRSGNRLGMGAGYYDRTFNFLKQGMRKPLLLGLAYDFQCVERLDSASWDVPLSGVVTESRVYIFSNHGVQPA
jgi:5-formyltetrahydrofolate cyclo-ligase